MTGSDYNEIEIDDLRLPFVIDDITKDDELELGIELDEKSYEIDASKKEVFSRTGKEAINVEQHFRSLWYEQNNTLPKDKVKVL